MFDCKEDTVSIEGFEWDKHVIARSSVTLHGERHRGVAFEKSQLHGDTNTNEQELGEANARPTHKPEAYARASRPEDINVQFGEMSGGMRGQRFRRVEENRCQLEKASACVTGGC